MAVNGTTQDRSNIGEILKNVYRDDLLEAIQNEVTFFADASRRQMPLDGTDYITAVHLGRNPIFAMRPVTAALPNGKAEKVKNGALRPVRAYTAFQVDNEVIKLSKRDEAAFTQALDLAMDGPKEWLQKQLERMSFGDTKGTLATVVSEASGVVTVDTTRYLEEGMVVDIWSSATSTTKEADSLAITSIDSETTFTLASDPGAFTAGGVVRFEDNSADVSGLTHYEMNGLQNITDDDTDFMGIGYALNRRWRATMLAGTSQDIGPALLEQLVIKMRQNGAGETPDTFYTHPAQSYGFVYGPNGAYADTMFSPGEANTVGADARSSKVRVAGGVQTLRTSIDAPKNIVFGFVKKDLIYGELNGIELEEFGESGMSLLPAQDADGNIYPAVRGWYSWRGNLGCLRRNNFGCVYGLNVPDSL